MTAQFAEFNRADTLWIGADAATMDPGRSEPYGLVRDAAVVTAAEHIVWIGPASELPSLPPGIHHEPVEGLITPGLVDCHTHIVYGGHRAREFELRLQGASYEEIARAGGGIVSTVAATRAAGETALTETARPRVRRLLAEGVTTLEIKSGYGLDVDTELAMLRAARRLGAEEPVRVRTSFLGAHALPPEYAGRADEYVDFVCAEALPAAARAGLADAVDAFCESIAFDVAQTERVFEAAHALGLPVKLHAEQLSDLGGAALAARHGALSADHLEHLSENGVRAMAQAGTVAVLLPGAFYFLRETRVPPVEWLRHHGVPIAIATDSNPGSSPVTSLLLMMNMGCTLFRLTPEEALAGVTRNGARALGLGDEIGVLAPGRRADMVAWNVAEPAELAYAIGANPCRSVIRNGARVNAEPL